MAIDKPGERKEAPRFDPRELAPWPQVDRYPIVIGSRLSFDYIGSVIRIAKTGYRLQLVDLLDELISKELHTLAVVTQRVLTVAGGRINVKPAMTEPGSPEEETAKRYAEEVRVQLDRIPRRTQAFASLLWGIFYGVSAQEIIWQRTPKAWSVERLHMIKPRRIAYPDQTNYHAHIWDQGLVAPSGFGWQEYLTQGLFGMDVCDYPNKFIVHEPQLFSKYPTEEGLGIPLAYFMALKALAVRAGGQFIEKYSKPWALGYYNTTHDDKTPRNASDEDIKALQQAITVLSAGTAAGASLPDSVKVVLDGPGMRTGSAAKLPQESFGEWMDRLISKVVLTQSGTTDVAENGARSALETMAKSMMRTFRYDADCLGQTLTRDLARPIVHLNHPGQEHLTPTVEILIDDEVSPEVMLARIKDAVGVGMPLDADKCAAPIGMTSLLVEKKSDEPRILYPVKALEAIAPQAPSEPTDEAETTEAPEAKAPPPIEPQDDEDEES